MATSAKFIGTSLLSSKASLSLFRGSNDMGGSSASLLQAKVPLVVSGLFRLKRKHLTGPRSPLPISIKRKQKSEGKLPHIFFSSMSCISLLTRSSTSFGQRAGRKEDSEHFSAASRESLIGEPRLRQIVVLSERPSKKDQMRVHEISSIRILDLSQLDTIKA